MPAAAETPSPIRASSSCTDVRSGSQNKEQPSTKTMHPTSASGGASRGCQTSGDG